MSRRPQQPSMGHRLLAMRPEGGRGVKRVEGGRFFQVEHLPADHSCGFHGLGISRGDAARALQRHRGDPEVEEFVAADLAAYLQSGERSVFPPEIRDDSSLWGALGAYYSAQETLDARQREARELLAEDPATTDTPQDLRKSLLKVAKVRGEKGSKDVVDALRRLFTELKRQAAEMPSGALKLSFITRLGRCQAQSKLLRAALADSAAAEQTLRQRCRAQFEHYVAWVGSDSLFWLSFIRGVGGEGAGGLLDALAKVMGLTVRIWAECSHSRDNHDEEPDLSLVHKASFGPREVDLWYQGDRGHFDRLVPLERSSGFSSY